MNQVTCLVQWKNLTQEQKDEFDFENYKYELQVGMSWAEVLTANPRIKKDSNEVFRLVIEDDKWYFAHDEVRFGKAWFKDEIEEACEFRPAHPDEIPQDEKTFEQKIQEKWPDKEVVMLAYNGKHQELTFQVGILDRYHFAAQSMKRFHSYVYQRPQDGSFFLDTKAVYCWNENLTLQPVAVLFEEEGC